MKVVTEQAIKKVHRYFIFFTIEQILSKNLAPYELLRKSDTFKKFKFSLKKILEFFFSDLKATLSLKLPDSSLKLKKTDLLWPFFKLEYR